MDFAKTLKDLVPCGFLLYPGFHSPLQKAPRFFTSLSFSLAGSFLRLYPPVQRFLDGLAHAISSVVPIPYWSVHIAFILVLTAIIFVILFKTPVGAWLDDWFERLLRRGQLTLGPLPRFYSAEERSGDQFKADITAAIKRSHHMYCLLVSAYTMVHETEEHFILDQLDKLSARQLKKKDLRILLLDRTSPLWEQRAEMFIQERLSEKAITLESYRSRCVEAEIQLRNDFRAKIAYYTEPPCWRVYMFDKRAFVSRYYGPPDETFIEGHLTDVAAFDKGHPMFTWMYSEFRNRSPVEWKSRIPADVVVIEQ